MFQRGIKKSNASVAVLATFHFLKRPRDQRAAEPRAPSKTEKKAAPALPMSCWTHGPQGAVTGWVERSQHYGPPSVPTACDHGGVSAGRARSAQGRDTGLRSV